MLQHRATNFISPDQQCGDPMQQSRKPCQCAEGSNEPKQAAHFFSPLPPFLFGFNSKERTFTAGTDSEMETRRGGREAQKEMIETGK